MYNKILFVIIGILVMVPTVSALSVELIENTDQCIFRNGIDHCFSKYLLCSNTTIKTQDIKFIFRDMVKEYNTKDELGEKLDYEFETEKKENCYEVSITGWKNPYINIDNILCYGDVCFYEHAWWNTSYDNKIPFYCYCPHCTSDTEMILLASNSTYNMGAYIAGSLELFWVNITNVNSTWRICVWCYFNDPTDYVMVDATETYRIEMFIDEGNSTSYGQTEENLTTWLNMKCFGTDCPDLSRYNNSGTAVNTPTEIDGKIGKAQKFTAASTEYITLPYSTPTTTMTINAWINLSSNTEGQIVNWGNGGGTDTWQFFIHQGIGDVYTIDWGEFDGGTYQFVSSGQSTVLNELWMVTMQKDGGTTKIYINGIENASGPVNVPATLTTYTIGARIRSTTNNWFDGIIDNVMVFNRSLSADEIMIMYNNTVGTHNVTQFGSRESQFPPPPPPIPPISIHSFIIFKLINPEIPFIGKFLEALTFKSIILFMDRLTVAGNVDIGGNLDVEGNISAANIFLPAFVSAHTNNTIAVASGGTWYNITFDNEESSLKERINHTHNDDTNDTFTIQDNGTYEITYTMIFEDSAPSPNAHIVTRIIRNNVEVDGFTIEEDTTKQNADQSLHHSDLISLSTGDEIKFQFTSDDTTVSFTAHLTFGIHPKPGHITIKRIV